MLVKAIHQSVAINLIRDAAHTAFPIATGFSLQASSFKDCMEYVSPPYAENDDLQANRCTPQGSAIISH